MKCRTFRTALMCLLIASSAAQVTWADGEVDVPSVEESDPSHSNEATEDTDASAFGSVEELILEAVPNEESASELGESFAEYVLQMSSSATKGTSPAGKCPDYSYFCGTDRQNYFACCHSKEDCAADGLNCKSSKERCGAGMKECGRICCALHQKCIEFPFNDKCESGCDLKAGQSDCVKLKDDGSYEPICCEKNHRCEQGRDGKFECVEHLPPTNQLKPCSKTNPRDPDTYECAFSRFDRYKACCPKTSTCVSTGPGRNICCPAGTGYFGDGCRSVGPLCPGNIDRCGAGMICCKQRRSVTCEPNEAACKKLRGTVVPQATKVDV